MSEPEAPENERAAAPESLTDVARIQLSSGSFDALRAVHFTQRFPPHFHDTFAIGVVESGATLLVTQRGEWVARAGTTLAFSPGEIHCAEQLVTDGYSYRMFYPSIEFMREIGVDTTLTDRGAPLFRTPVIQDLPLGDQFIRAHKPIMAGAVGNAAEGRLITAVRNLVSRYAADGSGCTELRPTDLEIVARARAYLHDRFAGRVRLAALADECGLSPFHMMRVFRRVVGVPPYAYLVQLRVNRAQTMLSEGSAIAEVAYSCGFSDQSHLTRTFRRAVGVPPGQYARQVRQRTAA
jgi:AraC-like DNA-binding protein